MAGLIAFAVADSAFSYLTEVTITASGRSWIRAGSPAIS